MTHFNDKETAGRESEPVQPHISRKYYPFGKGLVMASLNINSLLAHIDEFRVFTNESDIDSISINETKLDSSIKDNEVYIPAWLRNSKNR
jgi:hypothetical protein